MLHAFIACQQKLKTNGIQVKERNVYKNLHNTVLDRHCIMDDKHCQHKFVRVLRQNITKTHIQWQLVQCLVNWIFILRQLHSYTCPKLTQLIELTRYCEILCFKQKTSRKEWKYSLKENWNNYYITAFIHSNTHTSF